MVSIRNGCAVQLILLCALLVVCNPRRAAALDPGKPIGSYGHDSWTSERGLPGEAVYQILQSKDGYLWLRTGSGLVRFDGVRFVAMDAEIGNEAVRAIAMSGDGDLLIRTGSRTVVYRDQHFSNYLPPAELPDGGILSLFESREHELFLGSDDFIYGISRDGPKLIKGRTTGINGFLEDHTGKIWIGSLTGLFTIDRGPHGGVLSNRFPVDKAGSWVLSLAEDHEHRIWAGTRGGLYRLDGRSPEQLATQGAPLPGVPPIVNAILEDREGNLWAGTGREGLYRIGKGGQGEAAGISRLNHVSGLSDDQVLSLFEDREGDIWVGTGSGLDKLTNTALMTLTLNDGLASNYVKSVVSAGDGSLFAMTDLSGAARIRGDTITTYEHDASVPAAYGATVFVSKDGSIWMDTRKGLAQWKDGRWTVYPADGKFAGHLPAISEDDESLIVVTDTAIYRFKDGKTFPFTIRGKEMQFTTPSHPYVFTMYRDPRGVLWMGTAQGLYKLYAGESREEASRAVVGFAVTSIFDDGHGNLWLGGRSPGLAQLRESDGRVTHYTRRDGLFDGFTTHVLGDDEGNLWVSGEAGIFRVSRSDLEDFADGRIAHVPARQFGLEDGMKTTQAADTTSQPGGARGADGRLWFTTYKGLVVVDPRHLLHNPVLPPVLLEEVVIDGKRRTNTADLEIAPGMKNIEFHYTALSLHVPGRVRFKYQLEGYDSEWVDAGARRTAYYTNLRPGRYRFRVIASNDDGLWNEQGAEMQLVLKPHFYQTALFLVFCGVLAVLVAIKASRFYNRLIVARAERLKRMVEERTVELQKTQAELEQLAHFDALTSLPNRRMFLQDFAKLRGISEVRRFTLMLIDFDRFKQINDTHGHDAGDAFLIEAAVRLRASIRRSDSVARLGGDEFAILVDGAHDDATIEAIAGKILTSFVASIEFKELRIRAGVSIGVALFPQDGDTQEKLYKAAARRSTRPRKPAGTVGAGTGRRCSRRQGRMLRHRLRACPQHVCSKRSYRRGPHHGARVPIKPDFASPRTRGSEGGRLASHVSKSRCGAPERMLYQGPASVFED